MKLTTAALSLFISWVFLVSMTNAAPQQPGNIGPLSAECSGTLTNSVQTVMASCVNELTKLQGNITSLPTNPEDQIKLFVAGTKALCGARCFDTVTKATQNMESKCNKTNSPDENVMWFFKHALFGGKLLCQKDGDQLCVNNAVQQARGLNLLTDVLPLVMPLITSINTDTLATIPQRNAHELFDIAATYMDSVMTKLPAELVCGSCQKSMGIQAYSYFNNVYKPHVVEKLKQPDPSATVNAMWQKAVKKCLTPSPKAAKSVPPAAESRI